MKIKFANANVKNSRLFARNDGRKQVQKNSNRIRKNGAIYRQIDDYFLPNLEIGEENEVYIGV